MKRKKPEIFGSDNQEALDLERELSMMEWISVKERLPDRKEPVVFCRPSSLNPREYEVGIAYWSVSNQWVPRHESVYSPEGFTHWLPLPDHPGKE